MTRVGTDNNPADGGLLVGFRRKVNIVIRANGFRMRFTVGEATINSRPFRVELIACSWGTCRWLGVNKGLKVSCVCARHQSRGNCLLRSHSLTHFALGCQTTHKINMKRLLIAQPLREPQVLRSHSRAVCYFGSQRSIHIYNDGMLQGLPPGMSTHL